MIQTKGIPEIDPSVRFVGVSKLRMLNATKLHNLEETLVIQDDDKPLAVVLSYDQFLQMQNERNRALTTLEVVFEDKTGLTKALQQAVTGKTKPDSEVRRTLKKGNQKRSKS